jgi:hypothetical protein
MAHSPMQLDPVSASPATGGRSGSSSGPGTPEPLDQEGSTNSAASDVKTPPEDDGGGGSGNGRGGGGGGGARRKTDLTVSTERTPEGDDKDDHICVCTPAQKVPRPPNCKSKPCCQ